MKISSKNFGFLGRKVSNNQLGSVVPYEQLAYTGSRVKITCHSFHSPLWTKQGGLQPNIKIVNKGLVLIFPKIMESNSGTYTCHGTTNEKEMSFHKRARVYVGCEYVSLQIFLKCT